MKLKEICRQTRKAMHLSQKEFAKLISSTQTEVSFIEGGFIPLDNSKINAIFKFYKKTKEAK